MIDRMLQSLLGSDDAERVLLFLTDRGSGYGREIAEFWGTSVSGIQRQLDKLEAGGVIEGKMVGRTRVYTWNQCWVFQDELAQLLKKAVSFLSEKDRARLQENRRRPRRRGKPL
jgi:predicted ArsR family transcriptional regulator